MEVPTLAVHRSLAEGPFPGFHDRRAWPGLGVHLYRGRDFSGHRLATQAAHRLILVRTGCGRLSQDGGQAAADSLLMSGSIIFVPAGARCRWSGTLPECIALSVEADPPERAAAGEESPFTSVENGRDPFVEEVARVLAADIERPVQSADGVLWVSIRQALMAHLERTYSTGSRAPPPMSGRVGPKFVQVVDFVEAHLGEPIRLDQMAEVAATGRFQFARMFKRAVGVTPMAYVERVRIEHAKALLRQGGLTLAEVAGRVGFVDQSHFTRRFRRHTGLTPALFGRRAALSNRSDPAVGAPRREPRPD